MTTVRLFMQMVAIHNLELHQLDVTAAFLYGEIDKDVYVKQPPGHDDGSGEVYKLVRAVYGLKQAPRIWSNTLRKSLERIGFVQSKMDASLYILKRDGEALFLLDWVDDMLLATSCTTLLQTVKKELTSEFKMTDLGEAKYYLGMNIKRNRETGELWLGQTRYCLDKAIKFGEAESPTPNTPLPHKFCLRYQHELATAEGEGLGQPELGFDEPFDPLLDHADLKTYQQIVGTLNYAASTTRMDIAFAVEQLSRVNHTPRTRHMAAARHCLRYLKGTADLC